jgi:hypothetical protein
MVFIQDSGYILSNSCTRVFSTIFPINFPFYIKQLQNPPIQNMKPNLVFIGNEIPLFERLFPLIGNQGVNTSTLRPEGRRLFRVDLERRFFTPPSKAGLGAAEWVNNYWFEIKMIKAGLLVSYSKTTDWFSTYYVIVYVYALIFWRSVTHVGTAKIILHSESADFDGTHITET